MPSMHYLPIIYADEAAWRRAAPPSGQQ